MWFDTIKKEKFSDVPDGQGGKRNVSLDDRFARGRRVITPKEKKKSPRKSRNGVEGLYDYLSDSTGSPYDSSFTNKEWDSAIKELIEIVKVYKINSKGNTIPDINILELIKTDSEKKEYEQAIDRLGNKQKNALIKKIKDNFVKERNNQSFSESAQDRYDLVWRVPNNSERTMDYKIGTMLKEIKEESAGTGGKGSVMSFGISKPYTKEFEQYVARTFGSNISRSLADAAFKELLVDIKTEMTAEDKENIDTVSPEYDKLLDQEGKLSLKKAQVNSQMKYKPISLLDEEGYVYQQKHRKIIKNWNVQIKKAKKYLISRESKSYTDEYKNEEKYIFAGSKKKIVKDKNGKPKEVLYGGVLVHKKNGLPVVKKDFKNFMDKLNKENPMETLFKGDNKEKNNGLGLVKMYALLYGNEVDLQKTGIKSVKQTGLIKNLLEKSKGKRSKETETKRSTEEEFKIFSEILKQANKNKFTLAKEKSNKEMLRLLAPKIEDYLGGVRNTLNDGFKKLIINTLEGKLVKPPFKFEDYVTQEQGGKNTLILLEDIFKELKISFSIAKLTDEDVKSALETLNFDFDAFTEKMILAYDDNEVNMMNILESGRPSVDDEKLIRDVKLDLFFNDKYKKQRTNAIYEIYIQIDELEEDLNNNEITLDDENINDINTIVRMLSLLYAIAQNDDVQLDISAEDNFLEALEIIIEKSKGKVKSLGSDIDIEKVDGLKEMFEGLDLDRDRSKQEKQRDSELEIDEDDLGEMIENTQDLINNFMMSVVYDVEYTYLKTTSTMSEEDRERLFGSKKSKQLKKSYPLPEHIKRRIEQDIKDMPEKTKSQQREKLEAKQEKAMQYYNGTYPQRITEAEKERRRKEFDSGEDISDKEMEDWRKTLRNKKPPSYEVTPRENPTEPEGTIGFPKNKPATDYEPESWEENTEEVTEKERVQVNIAYKILATPNENLVNATNMYNKNEYQINILPRIQELLVKKHYSGEKSDFRTKKEIEEGSAPIDSSSFLDASRKLKVPLEETPLKITLDKVQRQSNSNNTPLYKDIRKVELKLNALDKKLDSAKDEVSVMEIGIKYLQLLTNQLPDEFEPPKMSGIEELLNKYPMTEEEYNTSTKKQMKIANDWLKQNLITNTKKKGKLLSLHTDDFN